MYVTKLESGPNTKVHAGCLAPIVEELKLLEAQDNSWNDAPEGDHKAGLFTSKCSAGREALVAPRR